MPKDCCYVATTKSKCKPCQGGQHWNCHYKRG